MFGLATLNHQVSQPVSERYLDFATRLYKLAYCQLLLPIKLHRCRTRIPRFMASNGTSGVTLDDIIPDEKQIAEVRQKLERSSEVPIAEIDQDGFFLSQIGRLKNLPEISEGGFLRRKKHGLCLVATEKGIGIRKAFKSNAYGFLRELEILSVLGGAGCNVPKIIGVDPETLTITISFIRGRVLREELAKKGALIRNRDMTTASELHAMSRIREGKRFLYHVAGAEFVERLWVELLKLHDMGVIWEDIKYGNVIIEKPSGLPYLIDFERSYYFPKKGQLFRGLRAKEIRNFNEYFR